MKGKRTEGFSLAEVTLAIGIAAIGLSIIFAVMPASMKNLQTSADLSAEHRIYNHIAATIRSEPWDRVDDFNGSYRFFTAQARGLSESAKNSPEHVYTARIEVQHDATGIHASDRSRRIVIRITHLPDFEAAFSDTDDRAAFRTYSALVTSMEK